MSSFSLQDKTRVYLLNGDGTCSAPHQRWGLWLSPNETMRKHWETIRLTIQNISYMLCYIASLSLYIYIWYIHIYNIYDIYIHQLYQLSVISAIYQLYRFSHPREVAQVTNIKVGCPHPCSEAGRDSFLRFLAKNEGFFHGKIIYQSLVTNDLPSGKHTKNYGTSPFLIEKSTTNGPFSLMIR